MGGRMNGGRAAAVTLPVDMTARASFRPFRDSSPVFTVAAGRLVVRLVLPERLTAGDVEFARRLADQASAYAAEVERRYGARSSSRSAGGSGKGRAA
ncbi:hypothetical protein [Actinomadura keratinilytica]|uniref:Uncharacterized protein n=1 Tax=Actinomadura keratinilytica TaxID=547461 RepID=A0ABP7Y4S1_9ACTN